MIVLITMTSEEALLGTLHKALISDVLLFTFSCIRVFFSKRVNEMALEFQICFCKKLKNSQIY